MSITSSTGLISGIDTASLIDALISLESQSVKLVQANTDKFKAQQAAYQAISAKLLSFKLSADSMANINTYRATTATSSNQSVLSVTSTNSAVPGSYDFVVKQLVSTQQIVTKGYSDRDTTAVTSTSKTLSFEFGDGGLVSNTSLDRLNGGEGVSRGKIRITDRSGNSANVDLSTATSINDVLDAINNTSGISVTASVRDDRIVLTDTTGATTTALAVGNVGSATTATDLGLTAASSGNTLTGNRINTIGEDTLLDDLNDGNGVRRHGTSSDFRVTLRDNSTFDVTLGDASTLGEVIDAINAAAGSDATAAINADGTGIDITDNTTGTTTSAVTALNSSKAAGDLGLVVGDIDGDHVINGDRLIADLNSKLLKNIGGGQGVGMTYALGPKELVGGTLLDNLFNGVGAKFTNSIATDARIKPRNTTTMTNVDLDTCVTVQDFINKLETTFAGKLDVSIEGTSLRITDITGGAANLRIWDSGSATFMATSGLAVDAAVSSVLSIDLDPLRLPTQNYGPGQIQIINRAGTTPEIDLTDARSVSDMIRTINDSGAGVTVSYNTSGNGLVVTDNTGGSGDIVINDVGTATIATAMGLAGTHAAASVDSGDLDVRYLSEATRISSLNAGQGITRGKFIITDSAGKAATVDLTQGDEITLGDVIKEINSRGLNVNARINDTGDGILIEDTGPGAVAISVAESGSTTARDLGILGTASAPGGDIDGSFEKTVTIDAGDTLDDIVEKINDAGINVKATVINDGSATSPFRMSLLSSKEGLAGKYLFDDGGMGLEGDTLVQAQNAQVFYGSSDPAKGIAVTSTTNTLKNIVPGATITLNGVSTSSTRVTIGRDLAAVTDKMSSFITSFNDVITTLDTYDTYDQDTNTRGLLFGDATLSRIRSSMYNLVTGRNTDATGQYSSLAQLGVTISSEGSKLEFNADKMTTALNTNREAVESLMAQRVTVKDSDGKTSITASGVAVDFSSLMQSFTDSVSGTVISRIDSLTGLIDLNDDRVENMNDLLDAKRSRLQTQFNNMELALANIQSQSNALSSLAALVTSSKSSS
ncbi:MAG: flagellar filament capping protein FliD [Phycisphaeraceae bacterium]|nr:flagellar filament capping protein FliD [Phycisphaeraceae bacterium]